MAGYLEVGGSFETPVYNFEVEDFHTYYVGDAAVWVHNTECPFEVAAEMGRKAQEMRDGCFHGETVVHVRLDASSFELMRRYLPAGSTLESSVGVPLTCEIQYLKPGVEVLSRSEATGEIAYRKIVKTFEHEPQEVFRIGYESTREDDYGFMTVTGNHPIWVEGKGWVPAGELQRKDKLLTSGGLHAEVSSIKRNTYPLPVYNLEVEEFHTYFVDWAGIWVHNKNQSVGGEVINSNRDPDAIPEPGIYKNKSNEIPAREVMARSGFETVALPDRQPGGAPRDDPGRQVFDSAGNLKRHRDRWARHGGVTD